MHAKILIVDDNADIVTMLEERLQASGYETVTARDGQQALDQIAQESPHLVLLDLTLPKLSGIDVLKRLSSAKQPDGPPIVVMTAHGSIDAAVEAMKEGAYDFLTKPLDKDHLLIVIRKALERGSLEQEVVYLRSEVAGRYAAIVGNSPSLHAVVEAAQRAAKSDASVLLLGESGTGKELFARSIHQWSHRRSMPLIVINCVALTETLLENELFGHERGAFTGADRQQKGKLEMADGGTVFLDEIGDMSLPLQAKLLRVLQDREFQRVGGSKTVAVNIRVIAATNKDLRQAVKDGRFREDLYFRLNVITLTLPPLRERRTDIAALAQFFLERHIKDAKRPGMTLSPAALEALTRYPWPGNIRELDNVIARAVVLSPKDTIEPDMLALLPDDARLGQKEDRFLPYLDLPYHDSMEAHSRYIIARAIEQANGNQTKAAETLQLQRTYLARLIKQQKDRREGETLQRRASSDCGQHQGDSPAD
jgi:DNA-binding NtrC family response regulator